jgi:hypothetical protein
MLGEKNGGKKGVWMGGKNGLPCAGWEKEREERKTKQNKRKSWPAARGWVGEKEMREREREKKKKACCFVPGWVGERKERKKKACCVPAGWMGERKERERERKKRACCVRGWLGGRKKREGRKKIIIIKIQWYRWSPKIKNKKL